MKKRKNATVIRWLVFLAVAVALLAALWTAWTIATRHHAIPGIDSLQSDTTVTIGLPQAPQSLDIRTQAGDAVDQILLGNVYETLVSRNQENKLEPGLAKSWDISKDGLTYTFTLRNNVSFSDGHKLDSTDVVWSLEQIIKNKYLGSEQLNNIKSVQNPNTTTVVIELMNPNPRLLRALSGRAGIVYDSQTNIHYQTQAMGSGPFTVENYAANASLTLKRNDSYWGKQALSSQITVRYFSDDQAMEQGLKNGDIQMAIPLSQDLVGKLASYPSLKVIDGSTTSKVVLAFNNNTNSIFSDQQVRQATRYLIDNFTLLKSQSDAASLLGGPISALEPGYEDLTDLFPFNKSKAQSLLSYFSESYLGSIVFLVPSQYQSLGNLITTQLESNGRFTVQMQIVDNTTMNNRLKEGDYTLALTDMDGTDDAGAFADPNSIFHYDNGEAQQLYASAISATNDKDYQDRMRAFAKAVSQDAASDWLYVKKNQIVVKTKLEGYPKNMTSTMLPLTNLIMK